MARLPNCRILLPDTGEHFWRVAEPSMPTIGCRQRPAIGDGRFYQISELTVFAQDDRLDALVSVVAC